MALKLWMGPSGSGKTHFLFEYVLKEAEKHSELNYYVIVPEQFTLATQRELLRLSKDHGILNVDVLSFARLSYRIFEEVGFKNATGVNIDDMGKNLILRFLASKCDDRLSILSGNMNKLGYITEVKSLISEFMQYGIDFAKISEMIDCAEKSGRGQLAAKLNDVKVLYEEFNAYIAEKYITKEEILSKASNAAYQSEKLKKAVVVFDGYTGFTPVQYGLIETLLKIAYDIHVTILTDTRDNKTYNNEHELFYLGYKTASHLKEIAKINNVQIEKDFLITEEIPRRYLLNDRSDEKQNVSSEMLKHLEKNLFREYSKPYVSENGITGSMEKPTKVVDGGMRLFSGVQPMDEVRKVAVEIKKIIESDGKPEGISNDTFEDNTCIRYKNIAVATGDLDNYAPVIKRVFAEYDIPYFIDKKQPVLVNPFIEYIRAMIGVAAENLSYSAMFRYLRSPLNGYKTYDIDRLENFVIKYGIKGLNAWKQNWIEKYGRYLNKAASKDGINPSEELIALDIIREKVISDLGGVVDLITDGYQKHTKNPTKTVNEINAVFIRVIEVREIESALKKLAESYSVTDETFEVNHGKEYEKVIERTIELFSRMSELLGDEKITLDEYRDLLDAGFDEIKVGMIPKITDYIQVGDITRSRFDNIHTLFIVGVNDGVIPKNSNAGGIISDIEREFLLEYTPDIELAPTIREQAYTGQLYLYMLMTKPKSQLFVSYSRMGNDGESLRPSYVINILLEMFPSISVESGFDSFLDRAYNIKTIYDILAENIKERDSLDVIKFLINDERYSEYFKDKLIKMTDSAFTGGVLNAKDSISKAVASVLYGKAIIGSVTRLEQFARCSFSYFLKYGLSLKEREIYSFEAKDMGNIFHSVIEKYSGYIYESGMQWADVSEELRNDLIDKAIEECISNPENEVLLSSSRHKYMLERIKRITSRSISVLTKHLEAGKFIPYGAELSFSAVNNLDAFTFKLSDDEVMRLSGKIDRLDTYEDAENERIYIKIIDYKSGEKSLDLVEIYKGLSLQLVVYLNAAKEIIESNPVNSGKEVVPAGVLYYHIDDPIVEGSSNETDDEVYEKIIRELKMRGLVNSDKDIYELMDSKLEEKSDIIPVSITKKGDLTKTSSVVTTEEFNIISSYVNKKIRDLGVDILSGDIKAEPHTAKGVDDSECIYCEYRAMCKFDKKKPNETQNYVNKDEVLLRMKEEA